MALADKLKAFHKRPFALDVLSQLQAPMCWRGAVGDILFDIIAQKFSLVESEVFYAECCPQIQQSPQCNCLIIVDGL